MNGTLARESGHELCSDDTTAAISRLPCQLVVELLFNRPRLAYVPDGGGAH